MLNNPINLNFKLNNISFLQKKPIEANSKANLKQIENDSFLKENEIMPPEIKKSQLKGGFRAELSDEQIAQINKAKMLPENARFYYYNGRGHLPYYVIIDKHSVNPFAKVTRKLPEGYEVRRGYRGNAIAVEINSD